MTIQIKRGTGAPGSLLAGELAVDTSALALYVGDGVGVETLLASPLPEGTTTGGTLVWNNVTGLWEESTDVLIAGGGLTLGSGINMLIGDNAFIFFGAGLDLGIYSDGTNPILALGGTAAKTLTVSDLGGTRAVFRANGDFEISGDQFFNAGAAFNTGFERVRVLDQATYDSIPGGPDGDTVYLITA